ncbi:hypothetical protein HpRN61_14520 [Helicobacter pylori]
MQSDLTTRITERSNQRAIDFTSSIQRIENTIRDFKNNSKTRARTILHNLYTRTRDAINAIKDIYRNAKERIRNFFQREDERLSRRMEQETRELHAKTTQLDRKIREYNQKIENERSYSRGWAVRIIYSQSTQNKKRLFLPPATKNAKNKSSQANKKD